MTELAEPAHAGGSPTNVRSSAPVRRGLVLAICCLSVAVTGIDLTIVNVALPSIGRHFSASVSSLQWTVDAYSLTMACLLILSGSLADRFGRRRIFQTGLLLFSSMSLLCAVAPGIQWLIAFRALQAVGGSMLNPVALSIIVTTYTDRRERARAIGIWGAVIGASIAAGPILGGALVQTLDWRAVFWVAVPVGIVAFVLTRRFVPESRAQRVRAFDPAGQAVVIVLFASLVAATIQGPSHGWTSTVTISLYVLAAAALVTLIGVEHRRSEPLIELRLFRSPPFSGANATSVVMSAALSGFLFLNTLYLQDDRGFTPLHAGLVIIPLAVAQAAASMVAGRLLARRSPRGPLVGGGLLLTVAGAAMSVTVDGANTFELLGVYALFGFGVGMIGPAVTNTAMSGMPPDQTGVAGALVASARQFGGALGVAVTGALVISTPGGLPTPTHAAWIALAVGGLVCAVLALLSTSASAIAVAERRGRLPAGQQSTGSGNETTTPEGRSTS